MTLQELETILNTAAIPVAHYQTATTTYPHIVYQEISTTAIWASSNAFKEQISVEVSHFTKEPFDPSLAQLKAVLHKNKLGFTISHSFNPENKVILNQFSLNI